LQIATELFVDLGTIGSAPEWIFLSVKQIRKSRVETVERKIRDIGNYAVGWQDRQTLSRRVEESHHDFFIRRVAFLASGARPAFVAVGQRGFIPVMPVRDDEFFVG